MNRPSFYMLVTVKPAEWRWPLIIPVPLFLVDEIISVVSLTGVLWSKKVDTILWEGMSVKDVGRSVESLWQALRRAGPCTLVDVSSDDVKVQVRLL